MSDISRNMPENGVLEPATEERLSRLVGGTSGVFGKGLGTYATIVTNRTLVRETALAAILSGRLRCVRAESVINSVRSVTDTRWNGLVCG